MCTYLTKPKIIPIPILLGVYIKKNPVLLGDNAPNPDPLPWCGKEYFK